MDLPNRYARPTAPIVDLRPATRGREVLGWALFAALACLWWIDVPRGLLSPWISAHFPWPGPGSTALTHAALFVDRSLIEAGVCIPAALVLAFGFPSRAVLCASLLAIEEIARTSLELLLAPGPKQRGYLLVALGLHAALLVGGAALFRARLRRR